MQHVNKGNEYFQKLTIFQVTQWAGTIIWKQQKQPLDIRKGKFNKPEN